MTVTANRYERRDADLTRREIVTPEGVPLVFHIARLGDRAAGFLVDMFFLALLALLAWLIGWLLAQMTGGGSGGAVGLLGFFLIRNGYFLWFEARWQGRTPGKRKMGTRVIDAQGGMLRMDQLIVRNLTREVEWFYPLILLSNPEMIGTAGPFWVRILSTVWFALILAVPFLNRERRRIGDLLAGTMVVQEARARLSRDVTAEVAQQTPVAGALYSFTDAQLEKYGIYELQVLEQLLREQSGDSRALRVVAQKIGTKIGWKDKIRRPIDFLQAFYEAQRHRLEHDLMLGRARESKTDKKS